MSAIKEIWMHRETKLYEIARARIIARSLGARVAAFYLRKRSWSAEAAAYIIGTAPNVRTSPAKVKGTLP